MKRNKFLKTILAAALPLTAFTQTKNDTVGPGKGFKISAGEGRNHGHIKLKGVNSNVLDMKISGRDSAGGFALFEQTSISQGKGTPLHVHHLQNEVFYVVEGHYYFQVGKEYFHLAAGDSIFLPMKVPHAWTQVSAKGKMTVLFQPAGKMEAFFLKLASLNHEPSIDEMAAIFDENEMHVVGPPLKIE